MKNIEEYGFERSDLVVATAVNAYLKNMTTEARKETLEGLARQDGAETVINAQALTQLIESSKAKNNFEVIVSRSHLISQK